MIFCFSRKACGRGFPFSEPGGVEGRAVCRAPLSGKGGGGSSAPSRPISYFASISTDEYRSGWDGVFGKGGKKLKGATANRTNKSVSKLPLTITLHGDDLEDNIREQLEAVFRQQAKKKRLNYDKLSGNGQVTLQVSCRISGT